MHEHKFHTTGRATVIKNNVGGSTKEIVSNSEEDIVVLNEYDPMKHRKTIKDFIDSDSRILKSRIEIPYKMLKRANVAFAKLKNETKNNDHCQYEEHVPLKRRKLEEQDTETSPRVIQID